MLDMNPVLDRVLQKHARLTVSCARIQRAVSTGRQGINTTTPWTPLTERALTCGLLSEQTCTCGAGEALRAARDAGPAPDAALLASRVLGVRRRQWLPLHVARPRRVGMVGRRRRGRHGWW